MSAKASDVSTSKSTTSEEKSEKWWGAKAWDWLINEGISEASTGLEKANGLVDNINVLKNKIKGGSPSVLEEASSTSVSDNAMAKVLPIVGGLGLIAVVLSKIL